MYSTNINKPRKIRIWSAIFLAMALTGLYLYLSLVNPFPGGVTDRVTRSMVVLASLVPAIVSTLVWRRYGKGLPLRRVWQDVSLALWGWTLAEVIYLYEFFSHGNYLLGPADVFWAISYGFFASALYRQYLLIYRPRRWRAALAFTFTNAAVLLIVYGFSTGQAHFNSRPLDLEILVNSFYVVGDIWLAFSALWLVFAFRDGALGRPWLGLLVFAVADLLYTLLEISGLYSWSVAEGNILTIITDTTYFMAYLAVGFGCYLQWLLLFYGPRLKYGKST